MRCLPTFQWLALFLACLGMLLPAPLVHAATSGGEKSAAEPIDVALRPGGKLLGQVVDSQGTPRNQVAIKLMRHGRVVGEATTDKSGYFLMNNVQAGEYQLSAGENFGHFRFWASQSAPVSAQPGVLFVAGQGPVRGQDGPLGYWLSNPWLLAGIVAVAIAVPVAVHNSQNDDPAPASP